MNTFDQIRSEHLNQIQEEARRERERERQRWRQLELMRLADHLRAEGVPEQYLWHAVDFLVFCEWERLRRKLREIGEANETETGQ